MASHNSWTRRVVATLVSFALATQPFPVSALALEPDDSSPNEATGVVWEEPFGQQGAPVGMGEDGVGGLEEEASSQADGIALVPQEADEQRTADASDMEEQQKEAQSPEQQESEVPVQTQSEPQEVSGGQEPIEIVDPTQNEDGKEGQGQNANQDESNDKDQDGEGALSIVYTSYAHGLGWQKWKKDGAVSGLDDGSQLTESVRIKLTDSRKQKVEGILYKAYVQDAGWTKWVADGSSLGKKGKGKRIEAIKVKLSSELAKTYDVVYCADVESYGWLAWTKNGLPAGSTGKGKRIEAVRIALQKKDAPTINVGGKAYYDGAGVSLSAHVQTIGWQKARLGKAGTTDRGLRVEAVKAWLNDAVDYSGSIVYRSHVQGIGWQKNVKNGKASGTTGKSRRVEAMSFKLSGQVAKYYDIYYRAFVQRIGWLGWAKNGQNVGGEGFGLRMESLEVRLVAKGGTAPSSTNTALNTPFVCVTGVRYRASNDGASWLGLKKNGAACGKVGGPAIQKMKLGLTSSAMAGGIAYQTRSKGGDWTAEVANGKTSGNTMSDIEAIRVSLTGDLATAYNVYYCVHVAGKGWLGWAKNGADAGTGGYGEAIDAFKVRLVAAFQSMPADIVATQDKSYYDTMARSESIEEYLAFAVSIANDDSHGYSQLNRWGPDYDCSSLVITSLRKAGLPTGAAYFTGDMLENLREHGWIVMRYTSMLALRRGDILLTPNDHTEFYLGNGKNVRAWMSEHGTIWGTEGDQNGHEIEVVDFHTNGVHGWTYVLRLQ